MFRFIYLGLLLLVVLFGFTFGATNASGNPVNIQVTEGGVCFDVGTDRYYIEYGSIVRKEFLSLLLSAKSLGKPVSIGASNSPAFIAGAGTITWRVYSLNLVEQ